MFFECEYCKKKFKNKINEDKHLCEKKRKYLLLKSKPGQIAYICYENWRKLKGFYNPTRETFLASKYFKSFINFIDFCNQKSIPEKNGFIKTMIAHDVQPSLWCNDIYYNYYMENFDIVYTPIRQVEISLEYLYKIANILETDLTNVFKQMGMVDLLKLIVLKKLSPWLLLFMPSFMHYIDYEITEEERNLLETIVNMEEWQQKIANCPEVAERIKSLISSLNI